MQNSTMSLQMPMALRTSISGQVISIRVKMLQALDGGIVFDIIMKGV